MLAKSYFKKAKSLINVPMRAYERMTTEDYLINIRKAMTNTNVQVGKLPGLLEASKLKYLNQIKIMDRTVALICIHCQQCPLREILTCSLRQWVYIGQM